MVTIFIALVINGLRENSQDADYYTNADLKLSGIITKVKPLKFYGHNYGVIDIDVSFSNKKTYDIRKESKRYLGVVKDKKASLVFNSVSLVQKGDSIVLNVQDYSIYREGKLIEKNKIGMPSKSFLFTPFNEINNKINL